MSENEVWFLNSLVTIRVSVSDSQDGVSILDHRVPQGDSPPLHLHRSKDEVFHVLEGEFRVKVREQEQRAGPGNILLVPKGVPHTYLAQSAGGGRFLTITVHGDFEGFVRAMGRPAQSPSLPPHGGAPCPEAIQALARTAARYGIEIVGPPLK